MNIHKAVAMAGSLAFAALAFATWANRNYGPFHSSSPDSGTCGNDWATDTFDRFFRVNTTPNSDGTYTVVEEFRNGTFTTAAGPSPGSCENGTVHTVPDGLQGHMQGSFTVTVSNGTFNPTADTSNVDSTASFVAAVFGAGATYEVTTYNLNYNAGRYGEWKNASADRGGDHGDIYTAAP